MPYNSSIGRGTNPSFASGANAANPLIPIDISREIIQGATHKSAVLTLMQHKDMGTKISHMPVLSALPTAYFVNGDTGLKQTTNASWENKYLEAEEIACIIPVPENVINDMDYDIWAELKPKLEEAIGVALDAAVLFGVNKPTNWPDAIATAAIAAGNTVTVGGVGPDIAGDINAVMSAVELDGFPVSGFHMNPILEGVLRNLREATTNAFLFLPNNPGVENTAFNGVLFNKKSVSSMTGVFDQQTGANQVRLIAGDWNQAIIGIRQDITYKMLDQAALFDSDGNLMFNLPQQDMVALRVTARFAYQVPNPLNRMNTNNATRYPFAVLRHSS